MNRGSRPGRRLLNAAGVLALACVTVMAYYFFAQESMIFHPSTLDANHVFTASGPVEEHFIPMSDGVRLNAVLVRAPNSRGVVYYLHGNAGSLAGWITMERDFTSQGYDFFAIDYRGYGKSEGAITSEAQFYDDGERGYAWLGARYPEHQTIIVGFSIGAGVAAHVACGHSPRALVLKAPFYSMTDLAKRVVPFVPGFLLKYPFRVHESVKNCRAPITIIHGDQDTIIPIDGSRRLSALFKPADQLVVVAGADHNDLAGTQGYRDAIRDVLNR